MLLIKFPTKTCKAVLKGYLENSRAQSSDNLVLNKLNYS